MKAAPAAQNLQARWPGRLVFSVGGELTLFMQGIVEGKNFMKRLQEAFAGARTEGEKRNKLLNDCLDLFTKATPQVFDGSVACNSLIAESIDDVGTEAILQGYGRILQESLEGPHVPISVS